MAYNGKMVKATIDQPSDVVSVFGSKASWFDISGHGQDKWCTEEGAFVVQKVIAAAELCDGDLDLFVISPFRVVAQKMRAALRLEVSRLAASGMKDPTSWISDSVGTVHTFQGKEAETVILLLGAPNLNQDGARRWAANNMNLMNVAVSRSKRNFYVVGNKSLWVEIGQMPLINREIKKTLN